MPGYRNKTSLASLGYNQLRYKQDRATVATFISHSRGTKGHANVWCVEHYETHCDICITVNTYRLCQSRSMWTSANYRITAWAGPYLNLSNSE